MRPFAVSAVLISAVRFLWSRFGSFVALGGVPLVLFCGVNLVLERLPNPMADQIGWVDVVFFHALYSASLLIPVPFYVAWHRMTLSLPVETRLGIIPKVGVREIRYGAYTLVLSLLVLPLYTEQFLPASVRREAETEWRVALFFAGSYLVYTGLSVWVTARLSFLFVGIAVDDAAAGWRSTKDNVGRLMIFVAAIWVAVFAVDFVEVLITRGQTPELPIFPVAKAVVTIIGSTILVSAVTIAFRETMGWVSRDVADIF